MDDDTTRTRPEDLAALHHPVRRRMLEFLNINGPSTVGAIAAGLGQQVGSVSHHLKTLERSGLVEPAPELATDRRESWWRGVPRRMSWSITDFADSPADLLLATSAERANLQHHADKVSAWLTDREELDPVWLDAAFATEIWATATPEEMSDLSARLQELLGDWSDECREHASTEDEREAARRTPVFVFTHGNPARP
jgi:DNA-binding transcriptional ArsR family regulator